MMESFFKNWDVKDVLAFSAASRAKSGFGFLTHILDKNSGLYGEATSIPNCRQMDILISHNFELLLDAAVLACSKMTTEQELRNELKVNHNLEELWKLILLEDFKRMIGVDIIKFVRKDVFDYFEVKLKNQKTYTVHELKNIRYDLYDFRGKENVRLRVSAREGKSMVELVNTFRDSSKSLMAFIEGKYR